MNHMLRTLASMSLVVSVSLGVSALGVSPASAGKVTVKDAGDADAAFASRRVALLIGVDNYADPDLSELAFAGKDARDVAAALENESIGDYDEVHVLTGAEATSRAAILAKLTQVTSSLQRDDTFLLYLSGHGTLTFDFMEDTRLWFLPSDAELDNPAKGGIEVAWLEETLATLTPRRRVLIMDTCHNGRGDGSRSAMNARTRERLASLRGDPPAPNAVSEVTESEARLYAAQYYQPAIEDKSLKNGVYTHYLLSALGDSRSEADLDGNGLVDVTEAHDFAQDRTIRHTGGLQVPRASYDIVGREVIYLSGDPGDRTRAERALISGYDGLLASAQLLIDGRTRGSLPNVIPIEPGSHKLEIQTPDGRTLHAERITVSAGEHLQIEELVQPPETVWTVAAGAVVSLNTESLPLVAPDFEVGLRPGVRGRWKPGVHLRASIGSTTQDFGPSPDGVTARAQGWMPSVGGSVGYQLRDNLLVGPQLELAAVQRRRGCVSDLITCEWTSKTTPTVLPGLRAEWTVPMGKAGDAMVRYDVRAVPLYEASGDGALQAHVAITQGLSVGAAF